MMTSIQQDVQLWANIATIIGYVFVIVGVVVSVRTYRNECEKERLEREYKAFNDLDDKYVDFMYICAQNPRLDLFSDAADPKRQITPEELKAERALFSVLISIFERAFIMFKGRDEKSDSGHQYQGWKECMKTYCTRGSFLIEWRKIGHQFDRDFQKELGKIIEEVQKSHK